MEIFSESDFYTDVYDQYGKSQWNKYKKLTDDQKNRIFKLKDCVGQIIKYSYRGKLIDMMLMAVITEVNEKYKYPILDKDGNLEYDDLGELIQRIYGSYPLQFRLNYIDNKIRDWDGFWTTNIDNVQII